VREQRHAEAHDDRAEEVVRGGRTRDVRTVDRMAELLDAHVDVDALV
jgi:hypothetical protein